MESALSFSKSQLIKKIDPSRRLFRLFFTSLDFDRSPFAQAMTGHCVHLKNMFLCNTNPFFGETSKWKESTRFYLALLVCGCLWGMLLTVRLDWFQTSTIASQLADIRIYMLDTAKYQVVSGHIFIFLLVIFPFIWLNHSRYSHSSTRKIRHFWDAYSYNSHNRRIVTGIMFPDWSNYRAFPCKTCPFEGIPHFLDTSWQIHWFFANCALVVRWSPTPLQLGGCRKLLQDLI